MLPLFLPFYHQANHANDNDVDWNDSVHWIILPIFVVIVWFLCLKVCWDLSNNNLPQPRYESIPEVAAGTRGRVAASKLV